jgi:hypothetical protein
MSIPLYLAGTDGLVTMAKQQAIGEVARNMYVQLSGR